jgi:hypothetical protein
VIVEVATTTRALLRLLAQMHDDDSAELLVEDLGGGLVEVLRGDRRSLSPSEARHVRAVLAAHRASPIN